MYLHSLNVSYFPRYPSYRLLSLLYINKYILLVVVFVEDCRITDRKTKRIKVIFRSLDFVFFSRVYHDKTCSPKVPVTLLRRRGKIFVHKSGLVTILVKNVYIKKGGVTPKPLYNVVFRVHSRNFWTEQ